MLFEYGNVLVFLLVGFGFVFASLTLSSLLSPKFPTPEKLSTYECGEIPTEDAWVNFNIRFYLFALLFIIFDVEVAFMFPIAAVFKSLIAQGSPWLVLGEIFTFVLILVMGLVYAWRKGDLEWVKKIAVDDRNIGTEIMTNSSKITST